MKASMPPEEAPTPTTMKGRAGRRSRGSPSPRRDGVVRGARAVSVIFDLRFLAGGFGMDGSKKLTPYMPAVKKFREVLFRRGRVETGKHTANDVGVALAFLGFLAEARGADRLLHGGGFLGEALEQVRALLQGFDGDP